MKFISTIFIFLFLLSCSTTYKNKNPSGEKLPSFSGESLSGQKFVFPKDLGKNMTLMLFGYKQETQFDIDRWLIGLDMKNVDITVIEVPTIQGFIPRLLKDKIDSGMRRGIPSELWSSVITVYNDGETIQKFTGNENPNNARVLLIKEAKVKFFYDRGFSVSALNELILEIGSK